MLSGNSPFGSTQFFKEVKCLGIIADEDDFVLRFCSDTMKESIREMINQDGLNRVNVDQQPFEYNKLSTPVAAHSLISAMVALGGGGGWKGCCDGVG